MRFKSLVTTVLRRYNQYNGSLLAKGLSYNLVLGLLPLMFLALWSAALTVDLAPQLQSLIETEFFSFLPETMHQVLTTQLAFLGRSRDTLGVVTVATFVITVFFLFKSLERTIRTMLGSAPRSRLAANAVSLAMVFGSLLFVYASAVLSLLVRIVHEVGILDSRLYPLGAFFLTLLMTAGFFGLVEYIFARGRLKKRPLFWISLAASTVWHLAASLSGLAARSAGRRFIVYGAMAGAVSYSLFLRILAEIIIFATLFVRILATVDENDEKNP